MSLELIVSPFLEVLFDKLRSLINREFHLLRGFNKDLEKLCKILGIIKNVLVDAEVKQITDKPTREWLANLKDAAYDTEDLLDELEYEAPVQESQIGDMSCGKQVSDSLSTCFNIKQIVSSHKMGKRIKDLIEIFDCIDTQRFKFQLTPGVVVIAVEEFRRERETSSILTEPIVFGRAKEVGNIIGILLKNSSSSNDLSICPIVGIGGVGKTTVAQSVYNDAKVVSETFWLIIRDSEIWDLEKHGETTILPALRLSYNHLPPFFRQCFGYCSVYRKDWTFRKERLIHEWMANSFIQSRGGMAVKEIGDEIFNGLCQRSFFQNIVEDVNMGEVKFKMHDLVHDLACSVMKECSRMKISKVVASTQRVRHLSVACDSPNNQPNPILIQPFLRTLIFIIHSVDLSKKTLCQPSFARLKFLRMLDLSDMWNLNNLPPWIGRLKLLKLLDLGNTGIASLPEFVCGLTNLQGLLLANNGRLEALPSSIEKLKNLRYLDLSGTLIKLLPESICTLTNLQTLNLTRCQKLERLPMDMKKMKSLRNLMIMWDQSAKLLVSGMPVGIGELTHLETLRLFVVGSSSEGVAGIQELRSLDRLKGKLLIKGIRHVRDPSDSQQADLKSKDKLSQLILHWDTSNEVFEDEEDKKVTNQVLESLKPHPNIQNLMIKEYPGVELPGWVENCALTLPYLRELTFSFMPNAAHVFHQLPPNLVLFWIVRCPGLTFHPELRFPSCIKQLSVGASNDPTLRSVEALPHLSKLQIGEFHEQDYLLGLSALTGLQTLWIANSSNVKRLLPKLENLQNTLTELWILGCHDMDCITEQGWRNLASLQTLKFQGCSGLTSLSDSSSSLEDLKCLIRLELVSCASLVVSTVDFQHLVALKHLFLVELPQLTSLPDGIQHVTTLQYLFVRECKNLEMLPEWLLQQHLPKSLIYLQIRGCHPELHKRCEDWHKISHLQVVNIE